MPPKSSEPSNYSLDEMLERLREGDREKRQNDSGELVTRPDGTQVMRVRKRKRRTEQPAAVKRAKEKRAKKNQRKGMKMLAAGIGGAVILVLLVISLLQLAKFNSESFSKSLEEEVSAAVGGQARISRLSVTPVKARAERLTFTWPETSMLEGAEFRNVEAGVGLGGFLGANWSGSQVTARSGEVRITGGLARQFPVARETLPLEHEEFFCESMDVVLGSGKRPPALFEGLEISIRLESGQRQVIVHGGTAVIRGWGEMAVGNGTLRFEDGGCRLSSLRLKPTEGGGDIILKSRELIRPGSPAIIETELINVSLGHLLGNGMGRLLNGTVDSETGTVRISPDGFSQTSFSIPVKGRGGEIRGLPFLLSLRTVLSDTEYAKPYFREISAEVHRDGDEVRIDNLRMQEIGLMEIRGNMAVNAEGALSGSLQVGIHENKAINSTGHMRSLAFSPENLKGGYVWFEVELGGTVDLPEDNWKSLVQKAEREAAERRRIESGG